MPTASAQDPKPPPLRELIAESPLVPFALAATFGLLVDRYVGIRIGVVGGVAFLAFVFWFLLQRRRSRAAPAALWIAAGCLAAIHHHAHRHIFRSDDIANLADHEPKLARV